MMDSQLDRFDGRYAKIFTPAEANMATTDRDRLRAELAERDKAIAELQAQIKRMEVDNRHTL